MPVLEGSLPASLDIACDALALIEAAVARYIRSDEEVSPKVVRECDHAYTLLIKVFDQVLDEMTLPRDKQIK